MNIIYDFVYVCCTVPYNKYCNPKRLIVSLSVVTAIVVIGLGIGIGISSIYINDRSFRLPTTIVPEHYNLEIQPYLNPTNFKFVGNVKIHLRCVEETDQIVIHSKELDVEENMIKLTDNDDNKIEVSTVEFETDFDFMKIFVEQKLKEGNSYKLFMKFKGKLARDEKGIFVYNYTDENNIIHYSALSSFESHFARRAFPCFDEPAMKATFDITVVRMEDMISVSNMPKTNTQQRGKNWKADIYETSQKISTCYVSFFVGNYGNKTKDKVTIWAPPHKISSLNHALDFANDILGYYENLLQIPYPLPTLNIIVSDEILIEGWGMVISPIQIIPYDLYPVETDFLLRTLFRLPLQIAKQWFGVLITPKWWDDIWTSLSFAVYISKEFVSQKSQALSFRLTVTECNIREETSELSRVVDNFEHLTQKSILEFEMLYERGLPIIRMLVFFLGEKTFWKGVRLYLNENSYESTDENTLLSYFEKVQSSASPQNLAEMIKPWFHLHGLPILTVTRNYEEKEATVEQVSCRASFWEENENDLWNIPTIITSAKRTVKIKRWITSRKSIIKNMPESDHWILLNSSHTANFVNYDRKNWQLLAKQLKENHQVFDDRQRWKLLFNIYSATISDFIESDIILEMYQYLSYEENLKITSSSKIFSVFQTYSEILENNPEEPIWKDYVKSIYVNIFQKVGEGTKMSDHIIRSYLYKFFCKIGAENCDQEIRTMFQMWMDNKNDNKIRNWFPILCNVIKYGGNEYWNRVYDEVKVKGYFTDEYKALFCSTSIANIRRLLKELRENNFLHSSPRIITELISNEKASPEFFQFFRENFNSIIKEESFISLCYFTFDNIRKPDKLEKLISILEEHVNDVDQQTASLVRKKITVYKQTLSNVPKNLRYITEWLQNWRNKNRMEL